MSYHTIQCLSYAIYLCVTGTEGWPAVRTTLSSRWPELVCTVLCLMKEVRYLMIQHPIVPASVTYLLSLWRMISTDRHKKDLGFQISRLINVTFIFTCRRQSSYVAHQYDVRRPGEATYCTQWQNKLELTYSLLIRRNLSQPFSGKSDVSLCGLLQELNHPFYNHSLSSSI